ncbi:AI-2E family transporter [Egicoccus halophilus]|nr:AI-2E family transporter [Egicoccus halophilus]
MQDDDGSGAPPPPGREPSGSTPADRAPQTADDAAATAPAGAPAPDEPATGAPTAGPPTADEPATGTPTAGEPPAGAPATTPRAGSRRAPAPPVYERVPSWLVTGSAWGWRLLVLLVGAVAALYVLTTLSLVTLPIVIALILATLCVPPARALERFGLPPAAAALMVVGGGFVALGGLVAALTPAFVTQVQDLEPTVLEAVDTLFDLLEDSPLGWDREEVFGFVDQGVEALQQRGGEVAGQVISGAALVVQGVAAFALAVVLLFFFVKDGEQIVGWFIARSPDAHRDTIRAVGRRAWAALAGFVRGTAAVALIDAIGIGVGLAVLQIPLVLPIAALVFLGGFIPVIGAFVTGMLAVLVALAAGGVQQALIVLAIVVAVQQLESNVLQPVIMRRAVSLHPVVILAALTAGAALVGVVGAFLAVPIAAVVSAVGNELRLRAERDAVSEPGAPQAPIGPPEEPVPTDEL